MQFLTVLAKDRTKKANSLIYGVPVLINEEPNGKTGTPIKLDRGKVGVSVRYKGAETRLVSVDNTTVNKPLEVLIMVGGDPSIDAFRYGGPDA
jgi:hypothetical protein